MNSTTEYSASTLHNGDATHVSKRARHHFNYEPLTAEQIEQLKRRLNALLFVPHGEIDDTRYEKLYSLLLTYIQRGEVVLTQFIYVNGIEIICQAARHQHLELQAVAIRLLGAVGATLFMNDWPTCLHVTLAELSATTPHEPLVLDAVLRAWTSLSVNDAITWSEERSRDLVALVAHAWLHASHFVANSAVKLLHRLIVHERVIPQHVVDEIKTRVAWQCQHPDGDFKLIPAVLDLFSALVDHVQGCAVLSRDRLLYDTVTRVLACQQLFSDTHVNTRLLELIDAATRVNQHALFGNSSEEISAEDQFVAWLELYLAPLTDPSRDIHSKEFEFAMRLLSHINFPSNSRSAQWHVQQCRRNYSHATDQHHLTFLICTNLIHHVRKEQLHLLENAELWEQLHNYLNDHVIENQSRALRLIEKNKRMILQLISLLAQKPNIDMSLHATVVLSYLTGQSRDTVTLPSHVTLVCNAVQCLTHLTSHKALDLTGVTTKTLIDTCQLGLLHPTWEIRETFLRFTAALMPLHRVVCSSLKHVIADKLRDPDPFVVVAALQVFQGLTRDQWSEWCDHVLTALPECLAHEDSVVRVTAWQVMTTWHQSGLSTQFLARRRAEPLLSLQDRVTAACQDEDWEVRQSALEWCHALVAHAEWQQLFELNADVVLHRATTDPIRLVRLSAYTALHALFKQLHHTPLTHTRAHSLLQELRETDWARVMSDQEPHAVYHEDDDVFPLEPDLTAPDTNPLDCPF